jgi:hypothetical protein
VLNIREYIGHRGRRLSAAFPRRKKKTKLRRIL